ncbi:MAG TPA: hypothetical protein VHZ29_07415, partial [Rhizomicrobium sp.]|nr:hypothetical protein [Rhizomicrobium sp.]
SGDTFAAASIANGLSAMFGIDCSKPLAGEAARVGQYADKASLHIDGEHALHITQSTPARVTGLVCGKTRMALLHSWHLRQGRLGRRVGND